MDSDEIYPYGWAAKGQRCEAQKQGNRSTRERINLVAGLKGDALLAPVIFTGYCDGNFFLEWLKEALIPELMQGDVVIIDNAPFHPAERITELFNAQVLMFSSCHATHPETIKSSTDGSPSKTPHAKSSQHTPTSTPLFKPLYY